VEENKRDQEEEMKFDPAYIHQGFTLHTVRKEDVEAAPHTYKKDKLTGNFRIPCLCGASMIHTCERTVIENGGNGDCVARTLMGVNSVISILNNIITKNLRKTVQPDYNLYKQALTIMCEEAKADLTTQDSLPSIH